MSRNEMKDLLIDYSSRNLECRSSASRELTRLAYCSIIDVDSLPTSDESSATQGAIFSHIAANSFLDIDASRLDKQEIDALSGDDDSIVDYLLDHANKVEVWIILG